MMVSFGRRPRKSSFVATTTALLVLLLLAILAVIPTASGFFVPASLRHAVPPRRHEHSSVTRLHASSSSPSRSGAASKVGGSTAGAAKQNVFGIVSDALTGAAFSLLHLTDDTGIRDASKNLRVLWARALLAQAGRIEDDVAARLLPQATVGLVASEQGARLFEPVIKFLEWIQARTEFIDGAVDTFLSSPSCRDAEGTPTDCQIVLFGAGYDTRALRYRRAHVKNNTNKLQFIEVDLPDVVAGKGRLYEKFARQHDPDWDFAREGSNFVPFDLNDCGGHAPESIMDVLRQRGKLRDDVPTMFVFEAVLFYVEQDAVQNLMQDIFEFINTWKDRRGGAESLLCLTDSLKPYVDVPFTNEADKFFAGNGLDLLQHRARWGGAVHFCLASNCAAAVGYPNDDDTMQQREQIAGDGGDAEAATPAKNSPTTTPELAAEQQQTREQQPVQSSGQPSSSAKSRHGERRGALGSHVAAAQSDKGELVFSYLPTQSNNPDLLENPSFDNSWYAVAYSWQIDGYKNAADVVRAKADGSYYYKRDKAILEPYATRFWGEPVVIYRDADENLVCVSDVCPHRSAPLSMGTVENGQLVCVYHGWKFGRGGECVDVPTLTAVSPDKYDPEREERFRKRVTASFCDSGRKHAVVERDGLVWLWRGENCLTADTSKLPTRRKGDMETITMDTVLDYNVDYSYIVENNLDSVHLFYLHDGSVPPLTSIGMMNKNLPKLRLSVFQDDCGIGHLGKLGDGGRPKKLIRFDPPNIVRHGGVSGFEEEFHILPVAPHRTRVLLRQHIPKGPILSTASSIPGVMPVVTSLVNNWNYHIGLEDACVMKGQSRLIEELGAPRMKMGGLGDDLVAKYWRWREKAHQNLQRKHEHQQQQQANNGAPSFVSPYFSGYSDDGSAVGIATGTSLFGDAPAAAQEYRRAAYTASSAAGDAPAAAAGSAAMTVTTAAATTSATSAAAMGDASAAIADATAGMWGIKTTYARNTPPPLYPPMNYKEYKKALFWDDLTKTILAGQEPSCTMIKTKDNKRVSEEEKSDWALGRAAGQLAVSSALIAAVSQGMMQASEANGVVLLPEGFINSLPYQIMVNNNFF